MTRGLAVLVGPSLISSAAPEAMHQAAMALTDRAADALDRPDTDRIVDDLMVLSRQLRDESDRLAADAGDLLHGPPPRRWRGDPPDVDPLPPQLNDLRAVQRWLWEWRCREGRLRPRSARERAIAATGERERQAIAAAPEPPPAKQAEAVRRAASRRTVQRGPGKQLAARTEGDGRIRHLRQL